MNRTLKIRSIKLKKLKVRSIHEAVKIDLKSILVNSFLETTRWVNLFFASYNAKV